MPQVAVGSEHTLISSMRVSPDRTVYGCVLAEVLSSGWRWPDLRLGIGYRRRSSTTMVAPCALSASSKNAKWWAHQSSEPPCIITVSTAARAEQRSHTSAAVRGRAGFLSSEAFISATPPRPSGDFFDIKCGSTHRDKNPTSDGPSYRPEAPVATTTSSRLPGTKQRLRADSPS